MNNCSDSSTDNISELLTKLYLADESENNLNIRVKKSFENNSYQTEIFLSEINFDVEDLTTCKIALLLNSKLNNFTQNNNKNIGMEENLLQQNQTTDIGLALHDEHLIIQDKNKHLDKNEKLVEKDKYQLQDSVPVESIETETDISRVNIKNGNNYECNELSEENTTNFNATENRKNSINEKSINEEEPKENMQEKTEKLLDSQNDYLSVKTNSVQLQNTSVSTENSTNLINNDIKENKENKETSSELEIPAKAYVQLTNDKNKETKNNENLNLEEYDEETVCGIGICKPLWLQSYATSKVFLIIYSIIGILQGSYYSYFIGSLSTLEKRFAFKSKISGIILTAEELTPLLLGTIIGYYATKAHRPRIVALGMILSAGSCFVTSLLYIIYGPLQNLILNDIRSDTGPKYCDPNVQTESCDPERPQNLLAVLLLTFGSFLKGFGNLAYYTIGLVYLDDNSDKQNTPIVLAITFAFRLLGPLLGFLMSSGFLKYYENPLYDPGFGPDDPRWIGAWWIGFFLQGILLLIFTIPIALFPRRLPSQKKIGEIHTTTSEDGLKNILTGLIPALKRLGENPVFIVLIISTTMEIFGGFGHAIMLPKYMEIQFRLSASEANLFSGAITIVCIIVSTLLGGFIVWKFKPRIKILIGGMIVSQIILSIGFLVLMVLRCQTLEMSHFGMNEEGLILNSACNSNCDCSTSSFSPFCGPDGKTLYFSPCYAGCTEEVTSITSHETSKEFSNCSCVNQQQIEVTISEGICPDENCRSQMIVYLIILFCLVTTSHLFKVPATMIVLRSVHPSDKSVALGTFETFTSLFGFIPCPVTYGALVDSACLVWEKSCGETGNCWFYDMEKYAYLLHGTSALFCSLSVVCLIPLYFLSPRIRNLYTEENEEKEAVDKYVDKALDTVSGSVTKL